MRNNKKFMIMSGKNLRFLIISFIAIYLSLHKKIYTYSNRL